MALLLSTSAVYNPVHFNVSKVVIDAGHGGKDPGTSGRLSKEKDVALGIALSLGEKIKKTLPKVQVIYTRDKDEYIALDERAAIANKSKADLFICIHANSMPAGKPARGTETFVMGVHKTESNFELAKRENSVILLDENYAQRYEGFDPKSPESYILFSLSQSSYQESSLSFAEKLENEFRNTVGRPSRGVKQAGFLVLWKTTMPSVLIETGFLSDRQEESYLVSKKGQQELATGIFNAFQQYKTEIESLNR